MEEILRGAEKVEPLLNGTHYFSAVWCPFLILLSTNCRKEFLQQKLEGVLVRKQSISSSKEIVSKLSDENKNQSSLLMQ